MTRLTRTFLLILTLFAIVGGTAALCAERHTPTQMLQSANAAYAAGKYEEAIDSYRNILAEHGLSPEILHNLGNSYAGNGQYGLAILQYLRGLRLAPGDNDIQADLELIRKKNGLFHQEKSLAQQFFHLYDMNQWLLWALISYILFTALLAINLYFPLRRGLYTICLLLVALISISSLGAYRQHNYWFGGVIVLPETRLLLSPFSTSSSVGSIEEGSLVFSEKQHGDYFYIRDESGRSGWVPTSSYRQIGASSLTFGQGSAEQ